MLCRLQGKKVFLDSPFCRLESDHILRMFRKQCRLEGKSCLPGALFPRGRNGVGGGGGGGNIALRYLCARSQRYVGAREGNPSW